MLQLYSRPTSSCSFRVRLALELKGAVFSLLDPPGSGPAGEEFGAINPQRLIPFLVHGDHRIGQSLSIIDYAEEELPGPKLLPADPQGRARVRAFAQYIVSEIQPLQNKRLDPYMEAEGIDIPRWKEHWIRHGLQHVEAMLGEPATGRYCHGDSPTVADVCLVPQVYNTLHMFGLSIDDLPNVSRVYANLLQLPAVRKAWPGPFPED